MALKEHLAKYQKVPRCWYMELYKTLSADDQQVLDAALKMNVPTNHIVKAIRADGHSTSKESVNAHRNGECICPKA